MSSISIGFPYKHFPGRKWHAGSASSTKPKQAPTNPQSWDSDGNAPRALIWTQIGNAPSLSYQHENTSHYTVTTEPHSDFAGTRQLTVPKRRAQPDDYRTPEDDLARAFRALGAALLGLLPAGLGAYPFLLVALGLVGRAWMTTTLAPADRARLQVALFMVVVIFAIALPQSWFWLSRYL